MPGSLNGHSRTRTTAVSAGDSGHSESGGAESGAPDPEPDPLRDIGLVWRYLTAEHRAAIVDLAARCACEAFEVSS